jgi:hypothetical protein
MNLPEVRSMAALGKRMPAVPDHHGEENDQIPVMLDQGIELAVDA